MISGFNIYDSRNQPKICVVYLTTITPTDIRGSYGVQIQKAPEVLIVVETN